MMFYSATDFFIADDNSKHAGEQNMNDKHLKLAFACESTEKAEEMKGSQLEVWNVASRRS